MWNLPVKLIVVIAYAGISVAHFLGFTGLNTDIQDPYSAIFKAEQGQRYIVFIRT